MYLLLKMTSETGQIEKLDSNSTCMQSRYQQSQQSNGVDLIESRKSGRQTFFTANRIFSGLQIIKEYLTEKTSCVIYGPKAEVNLNEEKEKQKKKQKQYALYFSFKH